MTMTRTRHHSRRAIFSPIPPRFFRLPPVLLVLLARRLKISVGKEGTDENPERLSGLHRMS